MESIGQRIQRLARIEAGEDGDVAAEAARITAAYYGGTMTLDDIQHRLLKLREQGRK